MLEFLTAAGFLCDLAAGELDQSECKLIWLSWLPRCIGVMGIGEMGECAGGLGLAPFRLPAASPVLLAGRASIEVVGRA